MSGLLSHEEGLDVLERMLKISMRVDGNKPSMRCPAPDTI
jgi:hypothetical protein